MVIDGAPPPRRAAPRVELHHVDSLDRRQPARAGTGPEADDERARGSGEEAPINPPITMVPASPRDRRSCRSRFQRRAGACRSPRCSSRRRTSDRPAAGTEKASISVGPRCRSARARPNGCMVPRCGWAERGPSRSRVGRAAERRAEGHPPLPCCTPSTWRPCRVPATPPSPPPTSRWIRAAAAVEAAGHRPYDAARGVPRVREPECRPRSAATTERDQQEN
jgi:hypothetical protein